jgi:hypothetical protein
LTSQTQSKSQILCVCLVVLIVLVGLIPPPPQLFSLKPIHPFQVRCYLIAIRLGRFSCLIRVCPHLAASAQMIQGPSHILPLQTFLFHLPLFASFPLPNLIP